MIDEKVVLLVTSSRLGSGDDKLGTLLMRSFLKTLAKTERQPGILLFLNGGVQLTTEGSPVLEELAEMERTAIRIYSCGTCLDFFELKDRLRVGSVGTMEDTVDILTHAELVIRP